MLVPLLVVAGLSVSPGPAPFYWQGRVAAGQSIEISNTYGSIRAELAAGANAEIVAHRDGQRKEPLNREIDVTEDARGVTVRALQPGAAEPEARIDFVVRVPKGVRFIGRTVNGNVEAEALSGDASAFTVNGDVRMSATGESQARTVNGSITALLGTTRCGSNLRFSAVNGGITLRLPERVNANLSVSTVHGGITSDFRLNQQNRAAGRKASAILGKGGPALMLTTINGNISVMRAPRV